MCREGTEGNVLSNKNSVAELVPISPTTGEGQNGRGVENKGR